MNRCPRPGIVRDGRRIRVLVSILSVGAVGLAVAFCVGGPGTFLSAATADTALAENLDVARALVKAYRFDEAQIALDALVGAYPNDPQVAHEFWWLGIKRRMARAEVLGREGRNVEAEALYKGIVADAGDSHLARAKARKDLMILYLNWGRLDAIPPVWADFAADPGNHRTPYALSLGEKLREEGAFDLARTAYRLAADGLATATLESDIESLREARLGDLISALAVGASGKTPADVVALASQVPEGTKRRDFCRKAGDWLLRAGRPDEALALYDRAGTSPECARRRVRALIAARRWDEAQAAALDVLRGQPSSTPAAKVAGEVLRALSAPDSVSDRVERGRAFGAQCAAIAQGDAAAHVRASSVLFLAAADDRVGALDALESLERDFATQNPKATLTELNRIVTDWRVSGRFLMAARVYDRLAALSDGEARVEALREAVKTRAYVETDDATTSRSLCALLAFDHPSRNEAAVDACKSLAARGFPDLAQCGYEFVLGNSPSEKERSHAQAGFAFAEMARKGPAWIPDAERPVIVTEAPPSSARRFAVETTEWRDFPSARRAWREILAQRPDDKEARLGLVESSLSCGDGDEALNAALGLDPADPDWALGVYRATLGAASRGEGDTAGRFCENLKALRVGDDVDLLVRTSWAVAALRRDPAADVRTLASDLLARPGAGHEATAMTALADALRLAKRYADARPLYKRLAALGGERTAPGVWALAALAVLDSEEGDLTTAPLASRPEVAEAIAHRALEMAWYYAEERMRLDVPNATAEEKQRQRDYTFVRLRICEMVARRARGCVAVEPHALLAMGAGDYYLERYDEANQAFEAFVSRYPDHYYAPRAVRWIGSVYLRQAGLAHEAGDAATERVALDKARDVADACARLYPGTRATQVLGPWVGSWQPL
ncbi:hypothetical protein JW916_02510, partial [Candidatus Sumerlaeota bacterium]|nr:hypothetical protein [Candidatus Sumerlaeota bacterium]